MLFPNVGGYMLSEEKETHITLSLTRRNVTSASRSLNTLKVIRNNQC